MVPMLAEESNSAEACDAVLAYLAAGSSDEFYSQLAANAEWQCCHREANYQKQVLSVLSKIRSISGAAGSVELSSTADELSSAVKRAEELNMSSLDEVSVAKGFHGQILSLVGSSSRREKNSFFSLSVQDAKNLEVDVAKNSKFAALNANLMALTTALERKDYGEVCRAMDLVRAQGLQRASVAVKAREFIASAQRLIFSIEHVQLAVSSAKKHGGLTQALHDQLHMFDRKYQTLSARD